ncbi:hypothetical protein KAU33_08985 [Candidatus Dependentiae bacterium]|nr:hypothetical protein [Candidatus Dependentiae bacterium]
MTGYDNGCGKLCNGDDAHFNLYILSNVEELPEQVQKALIKDEATALTKMRFYEPDGIEKFVKEHNITEFCILKDEDRFHT